MFALFRHFMGQVIFLYRCVSIQQVNQVKRYVSKQLKKLDTFRKHTYMQIYCTIAQIERIEYTF